MYFITPFENLNILTNNFKGDPIFIGTWGKIFRAKISDLITDVKYETFSLESCYYIYIEDNLLKVIRKI